MGEGKVETVTGKKNEPNLKQLQLSHSLLPPVKLRETRLSKLTLFLTALERERGGGGKRERGGGGGRQRQRGGGREGADRD